MQIKVVDAAILKLRIAMFDGDFLQISYQRAD